MKAGNRFEVLSLTWIEGSKEGTIGIQRPQGAGFVAVVFDITFGSLGKHLGFFILSQGFCQAGQSGIGHVILQSM